MESSEAEKMVRLLIWKLSNHVIYLKKLGAGVEGTEIDEEEINLTDKFVDYTVWNEQNLKMIALADVTKSEYSFAGSRDLSEKIIPGSKWFTVAQYKVDIMKANSHLFPTALIYMLNEPEAPVEQKFWWFLGVDITGKRASYDAGDKMCLNTDVSLWKRGLKALIEELLKL